MLGDFNADFLWSDFVLLFLPAKIAATLRVSPNLDRSLKTEQKTPEGRDNALRV